MPERRTHDLGPVDPAEQRAADRLDAAIDAGTDPLAARLTAALASSQPSPELERRIVRRLAAARERRFRYAQAAAVAVAVMFANHGIGNLFVAPWVAGHLGEAHSPHATAEGAIALVAVAVAVAVAAFRRRTIGVAVAAAAPLGIGMGVQGLLEAPEFATGAAFHLTELGLTLIFLALWWRYRRYARALPGEGGA